MQRGYELRANSRLFLALLLLITISRLIIIAVTMIPGTSYQDHPIVPMVIGAVSGLVLANRPRSLLGFGITISIALFAVLLTEVSAAMLVASYVTDISRSNPFVIMLTYWSNEPAYLLFSILGLFFAIPVYWSQGKAAL